jgi:hypothetical protein
LVCVHVNVALQPSRLRLPRLRGLQLNPLLRIELLRIISHKDPSFEQCLLHHLVIFESYVLLLLLLNRVNFFLNALNLLSVFGGLTHDLSPLVWIDVDLGETLVLDGLHIAKTMVLNSLLQIWIALILVILPQTFNIGLHRGHNPKRPRLFKLDLLVVDTLHIFRSLIIISPHIGHQISLCFLLLRFIFGLRLFADFVVVVFLQQPSLQNSTLLIQLIILLS